MTQILRQLHDLSQQGLQPPQDGHHEHPGQLRGRGLHKALRAVADSLVDWLKQSPVTGYDAFLETFPRTLFPEGQVFALGPSVAIVAQAIRLTWLFVFFTSTTAFACSRPLFRTYSHARTASLAADHAAGIVLPDQSQCTPADVPVPDITIESHPSPI